MRIDYKLPCRRAELNTDMFDIAMRRKAYREREKEYKRMLKQAERAQTVTCVLLVICLVALAVMIRNFL